MRFSAVFCVKDAFPFSAVFSDLFFLFLRVFVRNALLMYHCKEDMRDEGRIIEKRKNGNALKRFKIFFVAVFSRMQRPFLNLTFNAKKHDFDANLHLSAFFKVKQGLSVPSDFIFFENGNGNHAFLHFCKNREGISRILFSPL